MSCMSFQSSEEEKTLLASPVPFSLGLLTDHYKQNSICEKCNFFIQVELLLIHFYWSCSDFKKQKQKQNNTFFSFQIFLPSMLSSGHPVLHMIWICNKYLLEYYSWMYIFTKLLLETIGKKKIKTWSGKHQSFLIWPSFLILSRSVNEKENWSMCLYRRKFPRCYF